jgi:isopentenyl-diphosphate Delta-isomerase
MTRSRTSSSGTRRTVTTVDPTGAMLEQLDVLAAHTAPGTLHLACSAVVFGADNTVLLQRRADHKPTFGGRWSNTCCTHPYEGELPHLAAQRRIGEELGLAVDLIPAGSFRYRAVDPATGMIEHEFDHVSIGYLKATSLDVPLDVRLNENEVAEVALMNTAQISALGEQLTPWFDMVMRIAWSAHDADANRNASIG